MIDIRDFFLRVDKVFAIFSFFQNLFFFSDERLLMSTESDETMPNQIDEKVELSVMDADVAQTKLNAQMALVMARG
jgi:hypothetical protein